MEFFCGNNLITPQVLQYQLVFKHQYYPVVWVEFFGDNLYDTIGIFHGETMVFCGSLVETIVHEEFTSWTGFFSIKNNSMVDLEKNHQEIYETYHTWGGYFQGNTFVPIPINWSPNHQWQPIDIIHGHKKPLVAGGLNIYVHNRINLDFFYKITKDFHFVTPNTYDENSLMDLLQKNLKEDVAIEDYRCSSMIKGHETHWQGSIDFIQSLPIKIEESWFFTHHQQLYNKNINLIKNMAMTGDNPCIPSSIDGPYIDKIIGAHHNYQNFKWILEVTTHQWLWVGQPVVVTWNHINYYGIVIQVNVENFGNQWILKAVIKAYDQWDFNNKAHNYPHNFPLNLNLIKENWDQWHWSYDRGFLFQWPSFKNLYEKIVHHNER
jgi:hypothetical protein